jgi:hypothetical protein
MAIRAIMGTTPMGTTARTAIPTTVRIRTIDRTIDRTIGPAGNAITATTVITTAIGNDLT